MKLVDLNLILHAINRDSTHHLKARHWFGEVLSGDETVGLAWVVLLGFLRISTRPGAFRRPLTPAEAVAAVETWLQIPCVSVIHPRERHWEILQGLLELSGTAGNLTTDAHLAALAIEYGASLYSTDNDFARFGPQLRFVNPLLEVE